MRTLRAESGFTLIETLISMTLTLVVLFGVLDSFDTFSANARENERRSEAQEKARLASDQLARDLRNLASPGQNATAIEVADAEEIVFKAVDPIGPNAGLNSANMARVRYCMDPEDAKGQRRLWKQYQTWTTARPPTRPTTTSCPAPVTGGTYSGVTSPIGYTGSAKLADSLVNRGNGSHRAFSYNSGSLGDISAIKVKMVVDVQPEPGLPEPITGKPTFLTDGETELETGVALRNQNRVPTGSFSAATVGTRQIILNGSQSVDPEGAPLQYKWTVTRNGTTAILPSGPIVEYSAPAAGVYTFNLQVRDPADLTGDAPVRTVTVQ